MRSCARGNTAFEVSSRLCSRCLIGAGKFRFTLAQMRITLTEIPDAGLDLVFGTLA